jgi:hypothetical protein
VAGALPLDLAGLETGAREFFRRLAGLGATWADGAGRSHWFDWLAGIAVFAGGLAFRAAVRPPRRRALGSPIGPDSDLARWVGRHDP